MTRRSVRELVQGLPARYVNTSRNEKSRLHDDFTAVTGVHRKAATRRPQRVRRRTSKRHERDRVHAVRATQEGRSDTRRAEELGVVRRRIGDDRYEAAEAAAALQAVHDDCRVSTDFLQPVRKLERKRVDAGRVWKSCDQARTPRRRVLAARSVAKALKRRLGLQSVRLA